MLMRSAVGPPIVRRVWLTSGAVSDNYADFCAYDESDGGYDVDLREEGLHLQDELRQLSCVVSTLPASSPAELSFKELMLVADALVRVGAAFPLAQSYREVLEAVALADHRRLTAVARSAIRCGRDVQVLQSLTRAFVDLRLDSRLLSEDALWVAEAALSSLRWANELVLYGHGYQRVLDELDRETAKALVEAGRWGECLAEKLAEAGWDESDDGGAPERSDCASDADNGRSRQDRREHLLAYRRSAHAARRQGLPCLRWRTWTERPSFRPSAVPPPAPPGHRVRGNPRRTCAPPTAPEARNLGRTVSVPVS